MFVLPVLTGAAFYTLMRRNINPELGDTSAMADMNPVRWLIGRGVSCAHVPLTAAAASFTSGGMEGGSRRREGVGYDGPASSRLVPTLPPVTSLVRAPCWFPCR